MSLYFCSSWSFCSAHFTQSSRPFFWPWQI